MPGVRVRVGSTAELKKLARRLRSAGSGGLARDLTSGIRGASRPVLSRTKSAVRSAGFTGSRGGTVEPNTSTRLRARLSAATSVAPHGIGVRFAVDGFRVDPRYGHRLAKLTDTELAPRWRHPVFGNESRWTTQLGRPWFFVNIRAGGPQFRAGVEQAMAKTARKITD